MLNPITYTERVVGDFLRYQLTTYPFADADLHDQMRRLLSLEETRNTPLLKGPFISLSQAFARGASVRALVEAGILHPHVQRLSQYEHVYGHQQEAFESIHAGKTTVVSTGTGSGKTECFLYPVISHGLRLRDAGAAEGIAAVLVYPMNALAEDQLGRLRELLAGSGISFGMYVGKTPERAADVVGRRLPVGATREDYRKAVEQAAQAKDTQVVHPPEERVSREEMRAQGKHPRILLTNVKQLELLLTRQRDVELFHDADLRFIVFDEAHTFSGAQGAEAACLIRRLRKFCGKRPDEVVCVATSATIADPEGGDAAGREFAARFFGVDGANVAMIHEAYEADAWATEAKRKVPGSLPGDPAVQLQNLLDAVREVEGSDPPPAAIKRLQGVFQSLTGQKLDTKRWEESLYDRLAENQVAFQIAERSKHPCELADLVDQLGRAIGRAVPEEEVLVWLALGAISRREGRPLLRPVIHAFVRGMSGAVVTFADARPRLWLSREEALADADAAQLRKLDITTCTTCGQHYFVHFADDFSFIGKQPTGGSASGSTAFWSALDQVQGGKRLVLTNGLVGGEDEEAEDDEDGSTPAANVAVPKRTSLVYMCRTCGALHREPGSTCLSCGRSDDLVSLLAIVQRENAEGFLNRCIACGANGRRMGSNYREPARPVRAITVSDVHVLAQNMLQQQQASERKRLIIFADNRQDAAFQAGWMQDHARRYRLRALMYERIQAGPVSIGDLVAWLDRKLEADDELSGALIPEVWRAARKEAAGGQHGEERRLFLRIHVLREVTNGLRQRIGLEPWGRLQVRYLGLESELPFFRQWAAVAGCTPEAMCEAAASLLDLTRRSAALFDREYGVFTRWWSEGQREVLAGYIQPSQAGPKAVLCERTVTHSRRLGQWLSTRGQTRAVALAKRWGIEDDLVRPFLEGLWKLLADELGLLVPVTLRNRWNKPLPETHDARQVDADRILLEPHHGLYRCGTCRRTQLRAGPKHSCIQWRCSGTVKHVDEDPDNYDLRVLDEHFTLVRAREHSAQVPAEEREQLERRFKADGERVNTLVATPTLELGVDIGALDAVLMRNVPPVAANYWQRAGRAGRRHRMAVNLTYAGTKTHDRAYFHDPLKLLGGQIQPPRFNLKNEPMVRKHVHATVLSELHQLARTERGLAEPEREAILAALAQAFPNQVRGYLFSSTGDVMRGSLDLAPFEQILTSYHGELIEHVGAVFTGCWPREDRDVVRPERLAVYVREMTDQLREVIARLARRLQWALTQMARLDDVRKRKGTLDPAEESMRSRCDRMIKRLKGMSQRRRGEAEGYDDTLTYSVLAAEGFLPGYGLDVGTVLAYHQAPRSVSSLNDFQFRRAKSLALREYAPGNFLYANGHRFFPRFFHLEAVNQGGQVEPLAFQVDVANEAVTEIGTATNMVGATTGAYLPAVPICDVDLPHQSHIADDEDYRFQLPVAVYGHELDVHEGGRAYRWDTRDVQLRRQVRLRLVNVGARRLIGEGNFGYPVCLVCGQSRSPFASQAELSEFSRSHQERCGQPVGSIGFYADEIADALRMGDCANRSEAHSLAEALRMGAADVLEMERDDLQILVVGQPGREQVDLLLYDPMSGGSGLLDQMVQRWDEVVVAARKVTAECPSQCDVSCIDCLQHYRNAWAHSHLDRHLVVECIDRAGLHLIPSHEIPECRPNKIAGPLPSNLGETELELMLLRAGFSQPERQREIDLGMPLGLTTPDFFYEDLLGHTDGLCIYLDGLSEAIHGNPEARRRDRRLRQELEARDFEVVEIVATELNDLDAMRGYFARIARILVGKQRAKEVREDISWFQHEAAKVVDGWAEVLELIEDRWRPLFEGLRERGVSAPDEIEWDIRIGGRVIEGQAVAVWRPDGSWLVLVEAQVAAALDKLAPERVVIVTPTSAAQEIAELLLERVGGGEA